MSSTRSKLKFRAWFAEFDAMAWDKQIEQDAGTGKLDDLAAEALDDYQAGSVRELWSTQYRSFRVCLEALPPAIKKLARRNFKLLKEDPSHPSLHFKSVPKGQFYSARVGLYVPGGVHWFWVGTHGEYDKLVG